MYIFFFIYSPVDIVKNVYIPLRYIPFFYLFAAELCYFLYTYPPIYYFFIYSPAELYTFLYILAVNYIYSSYIYYFFVYILKYIFIFYIIPPPIFHFLHNSGVELFIFCIIHGGVFVEPVNHIRHIMKSHFFYIFDLALYMYICLKKNPSFFFISPPKNKKENEYKSNILNGYI